MLYDIFEWLVDYVFMPVFILVVILLFFVAIPFLIYGGIKSWKAENENCAKWEYKIVRQEAWTQYVYSGKVMVPIFHPARDVNEKVCVEVK